MALLGLGAALIDFLIKTFYPVWDLFFDAATMAWQWANNVLGIFATWVVNQMPAGWAAWFRNTRIPALAWQWADKVDWFIPWKICIGIWVFSMTIAGAVRVVRWFGGVKILGTGIDT
jgi:hypothetical protein